MSGSEYLRSRLRSIQIAFGGIIHVLVTQQNARIHAGFTVAVILLGLLLDISYLEWMILLLVIGSVWSAEFFNTAVELVADHVSPDEDPVVKIIKDVSAGGVLIAVIISILIGLLIFGPRLWKWMVDFIPVWFH